MSEESTEIVEKVTGDEKAAIFLMTLGEGPASEILKHLGPKEVHRVGTSMANLENISKPKVNHVIREFASEIGEQTALGVDSDNYIRSVLVDALGEGKASGMIDKILLGRDSKGLEALKWMDARAVVEVIRTEHPQIIAIVLSYLDPDHSAQVLGLLPENIRPDVVMRIATLEGVQPQALQELDAMLEKQFSSAGAGKSSGIGGLETAANILNFLESSVEESLMETVKEQDEGLGESIEDLMFVFENLMDVDDRGIQTMLREVSSDLLIPALKGADENMKEKFLKNMSKRAAEMLRDDLEVAGPMRVSDVETAQKEILNVARRLADEGEIMLGGSGDDFV